MRQRNTTFHICVEFGATIKAIFVLPPSGSYRQKSQLASHPLTDAQLPVRCWGATAPANSDRS